MVTNQYLTLDKKTMLFVRIGILVATLAMLVCAVAVAWFAVNTWRNAYLETQARIRYQDALIENIGKPQIIEQRYYSPMNNKEK